MELARLKKEEESRRRKKNIWPVLRIPGLVPSRYNLAPLGVFFVMKTLGDEWYVVIKAYKRWARPLLHRKCCCFMRKPAREVDAVWS